MEMVSWRVPNVGSPNLRNSVDFSSQTRGPTPMPTRQSIHCVPELDRTLRSCSAQRSVQVRSESRERLEVEVGCQSTFSAGACPPMMD